MSIAAIRESVIRAGLDASNYERGARQVEQANERVVSSSEQVVEAQERTTRSFSNSGGAIERLQRTLDQAYGAQRRFEQVNNQLIAAVERGRITQQRANELLELARQRYLGAAAGASALSAANDNAGRSGRNMGQLLGQAGFQIQDFASQVAGGQNALVAFAQQGSQLLGVFGTAGAIAGAILTVGVLAARLLGLGSSTREAKDATEEFNKALQASGEFLETAEERTRRLYEEKRRETQETLKAAAAIQMETMARAQAAEQRAADDLAAIQRAPADPRPGMRDRAIEQVNLALARSREVANNAALAIGRLLDEYEKVSRAQPEAARGIRGVGAANDDTARSERERIALANQLERDLQDAIDKENALVEARRKQVEEVDALVAADQRRARETYERQLERSIGAAVDRGADIFYDLFTGKARDFGEVLRQIVARAMAQAAAEVVLRPIVAPIVATALGVTGGGGTAASGINTASSISSLTGVNPLSSIGGLSGVGTYINGVGYSSGLTGIGAMNTPMGFSPAASGALGPATATQLFGAAGVGFGSGYFLSSATGNRAVGTVGGAAVGAGYGFMVGGPPGAVIGAIAGGAGGLVGGMGQRGDPYVQGSIALGPDGRLVGRAAADNRGDPSGTQQQIDQAIAQLQAITSARGLQFTRGADLFGDRTGRTLEQALDEIASGVRSGPGTSARVRSAIDGGSITSLQGLSEALAKADEIDAFTESVRRATLSLTDKNALALEDQEKGAQARLDQARRLGLDLTEVERLNALERAEVLKAVNDNIVRESQEAFDLILQGATERRRQAEEDARAQQAAAASFRQTIAGIGDRLVQEAQRIREEVDAALLGPYSNLSPEARLALAQQRFQSGQLGLNDFLGEGARAYGTATTAYASFFDDALSSARARAASLDASAASIYASLREAPGFATGGSFDVVGPPGNDNIFMPRFGARFTAGETVNVSTRDTMATLIAETRMTREVLSRLLDAFVGIGGEQLAVSDQLRRSFAGVEAIQRHRRTAA